MAADTRERLVTGAAPSSRAPLTFAPLLCRRTSHVVRAHRSFLRVARRESLERTPNRRRTGQRNRWRRPATAVARPGTGNAGGRPGRSLMHIFWAVKSYVRNYIEEYFELSPSHITLQPQIHSAKEMGLACKHNHKVSQWIQSAVTLTGGSVGVPVGLAFTAATAAGG